MLEGIDALVALQTFGTVTEAATRLRLTQSAVSKRLQALQQELGFRLLEPEGRRVRLTARAEGFLARARPLVAELRALTRHAAGPSRTRFSLALADSIAVSWGPRVVSSALRALPGVEVELHAHRSVLVIETVRLGRYDVGLCTEPQAAPDLVQHALVSEPMVLVPAELARRAAKNLPLIAIEASSATWRAVQPLLRARHPRLLQGPVIEVESFGAVVQMARAGFGNGLVPLGLAVEMRLPRSCRRPLAGVSRRLVLLTRKIVQSAPSFAALHAELAHAAAEVLSPRSPTA
jgi:DNA-binding transcriptional LysR family regulator